MPRSFEGLGEREALKKCETGGHRAAVQSERCTQHGALKDSAELMQSEMTDTVTWMQNELTDGRTTVDAEYVDGRINIDARRIGTR